MVVIPGPEKFMEKYADLGKQTKMVEGVMSQQAYELYVLEWQLHKQCDHNPVIGIECFENLLDDPVGGIDLRTQDPVDFTLWTVHEVHGLKRRTKRTKTPTTFLSRYAWSINN
jgi:hypothetical protein